MDISSTVTDDGKLSIGLDHEEGVEQPTIETLETTPKMDCIMKKCIRCLEAYGEERVPRTLICGHSLCTPCSEQCLAGPNMCPECNEKLQVENANDLPVNYPLLRLIRSFSDVKDDIRDFKMPTFFSDIMDSRTHEDICKCSAHANPISKFCYICSAWLCLDCLVVDHPFLPRGSCRILGLTDAMNRIRSAHKNLANQILRDTESMRASFNSDMAIHEFCLKYCSDNRQSHTHLRGNIESHLDELRKSNDAAVEKTKERVSKSLTSVEETMSPEVMSVSCKDLLNSKEGLENDIKDEKQKRKRVLKSILEHFRMDLKNLAQGRVPVYAIIEESNGSRWAPISLKENRLLVYSSHDGKPPTDGINVPFEHVKKLIPAKEDLSNIFFEVGTAEEYFGRVHVQLYTCSVMAQQTISMCLGEKGVTYRGTCFHKLDEKEGILHGGDYENNDGSGGRPIVQGLADCYFCYYMRRAGAFVGDTVSTKFQFELRCCNKAVNDFLGKVSDGLKVLKSLPKVSPISKVIVRDCGAFIRMIRDNDDDDDDEEEEYCYFSRLLRGDADEEEEACLVM